MKKKKPLKKLLHKAHQIIVIYMKTKLAFQVIIKFYLKVDNTQQPHPQKENQRVPILSLLLSKTLNPNTMLKEMLEKSQLMKSRETLPSIDKLLPTKVLLIC